MAASILLAAAAGHHARAAAADDRILVVGALHTLHEREPGFDYDALRAAIEAFAPDVMVLEVRPDKLADRKATPGRPEYPAVIWPLLDRSDVRAVAMEPGGETFAAISGAAGAAFAALRERDPAGAAALARLERETDAVLLTHWQSAVDVHDELTAKIIGGVQAAQFALAGPAFVAAQSDWDHYMAEQAVAAVQAHPGKRVMIVGSYKNHALLEKRVGEAAPQRLTPAAIWFGTARPATVGPADLRKSHPRPKNRKKQ